jgi:hypothetical protein
MRICSKKEKKYFENTVGLGAGLWANQAYKLCNTSPVPLYSWEFEDIHGNLHEPDSGPFALCARVHGWDGGHLYRDHHIALVHHHHLEHR